MRHTATKLLSFPRKDVLKAVHKGVRRKNSKTIPLKKLGRICDKSIIYFVAGTKHTNHIASINNFAKSTHTKEQHQNNS